MSAFRRYILLALLTGFSGPGFPTATRAAGTAPDAPDFNFTHYNSGNSELPYDRVNKIVQDSQGFIWFGTSSGLSRFDGIRFRNYTKEEMGLKSAYVIALCTDSEGNLWIGTDRGVSVYDVDRDRFEPFLRESDLGTVIRNKANVIRRGPDGVMWISVNNQGLFAYDPRTQILRNHFFENGRQTLPVNIRALHVDGDNGLWIGLFYHSFLYIGHDSADQPRRDDARKSRHSGTTTWRRQFGPGRQRNDLRGQRRRGLCLLNRSSGRIRTLIPVPSRGFTPEDLYVDREGIVWMSTSEGVYRYDPRTDSARKLACDSHNRFSLSDSHAFAGLHRRLGRHLDRHERRRSELLRRLPAAVREVPRRRRAFVGRLPRAGLRGRRRGAHLDRHRKRGSASLRHGAPHAEPGRARPTPQHAVLDLLRTGRAVARNRQGALPARHPHAGRAGIRNARLCHGDA